MSDPYSAAATQGTPLRFDAAPWSTGLKILTLVSMLILFGVMAIGAAARLPVGQTAWFVAMIGIPLLVAVIAPAFMIRGFAIVDRRLLAERPFWTTRIGLEGLQSATVDPAAMQGAWRSFGNGGLFCYAGKFWSKKLGHFRVLVTHPGRSVVLRFADRTVVVSPDRPDEFARRLNELAGG